MASFDLNALSGINAAANGLTTISNNLANAQTVGFKSSRAEFSDMFSGNQHSAGNGVRVGYYTQDFGQGTISNTGRDLDLAIDGEGFFILDDKTDKYPALYTRDGSFKLDKDGFITSQAGNKLQGFLLNQDASTENEPVFETTLSSINLDGLKRTLRATDEMQYDINLDGSTNNNKDINDEGIADPTTIDGVPNLHRLVNFEDGNDANSSPPDFTITKNVYDSLGGEHRLTANYYKRDVVSADLSTDDYDGDGNNDKYSSWIVQYSLEDYNPETDTYSTSGHVSNAAGDLLDADGAVVPIPAPDGTDKIDGQIFELRFNTDGILVDVLTPNDLHAPVGTDVDNAPLDAASWTSTGNKGSTLNWVIDSGAADNLGNPKSADIGINVDFSQMTQFAGTNSARGVTQNGFKVGNLVALSVSNDGVIEAKYSNGRSLSIAQVGLANVMDKNGLDKLGGQTYAESYESGGVRISPPEKNGFGSIKEGSLEFSNVDTTGELVKMIQTQRTYQASAQVVSTSQTLFQAVINL